MEGANEGAAPALKERPPEAEPWAAAVGVDGWGGLLLGLAARGTVVLAESVAPGTGQARVVAQQVLGRFTHGAQGQSGAQALRFVDRGLSYTGLLSEGFLFLVAGKLACGTEKPRQCLEAMRAELGGVLQQKGGRAKAGGLQKQLEVKIRKCLHQTLQAPAGGKLGEAKQNLEDIQVIMSNNIEKILDRGEKLETLTYKTESLMVHSAQFHNKARQLRRQMWLQNMKMYGIVLGIILIIVLVLVFTVLKPFR